MTQAYPLKWPEGKERTPRNGRKRANFVVPPVQAIQELLREISLLGGRYPVISSNMPMRQDGLPYAKAPNPAT